MPDMIIIEGEFTNYEYAQLMLAYIYILNPCLKLMLKKLTHTMSYESILFFFSTYF